MRLYLRREGYRRRRPNPKKTLEPEHIVEREWFCQEYHDFQAWEYVVYSDEAGFWVGWFKRDSSANLDREQHPAKLNAWAAISAFGKIGIYLYEENLDTNLYVNILNWAIPRIQELYPHDFVFQQDNSSIHTSEGSQQVLARMGNLLDWPSVNPDLKKRMPRNIQELRQYLLEEWERLDDMTIFNLCLSLPSRIALCIDSNYQRIKY